VAKTGSVALNNLVVSKVVHGKTASSMTMSKNVQGQQYVVTIETAGQFPDGMDPRPDDTIDLALNYDPKVKA
jgi:hypothetical protein